MEKVRENKFILVGVLVLAVYLFLQYITPLIAPALIAMLFVTIFGPGLLKMQQKLHIHRQVGALLLLLLGSLILLLLLWVLGSFIINSLPGWLEYLNDLQYQLAELINSISAGVTGLLGLEESDLQQNIRSWMEDEKNMLTGANVSMMLDYSLSSVKWLGHVGAFIIVFLVAAVLLAKDYDEIMNNLLEKEEYHVILEVICGIIRYIAVYVKAQMILMLTNALLCSVLLSIAGIKNGILWGLLAGLMDVFPFVGTGIVLIPLAIIQVLSQNYVAAGVCIGASILCVVVRDILEPKLIGKKAGIRPIAVLLSLYAGIRLFGLWGIIKGPLGYVIIRESYEGIMRRIKPRSPGPGGPSAPERVHSFR